MIIRAVIGCGNIADGHPYLPTPRNAGVRNADGVPGPGADAVGNTPIFEDDPAEGFKEIEITRAVRGFGPCPPHGGHMSLGRGREPRTPVTPHSFSAI